MKVIFWTRPLAWAVVASLAACGGGGDAGPSAGAGGTSGSALYAGPISGLGSVVVNGVRFSTVGASLSDDDGSSQRVDDLKLGQTVKVVGSSDDATQLGAAGSITVVRGLQGAIATLNPAAGSFTLLGQQVGTNAATVFQGAANLAALAVGDTVEVYGLSQADGSWLATLIEKKALAGSGVRGKVAALNPTAKTFRVGGLDVSYAAAAVTGTLAEGQVVRVKSGSGPVGNVLTASSVKPSDDAAAYAQANAGQVKVKGVVEAAPVAGKFKVSGTPVDAGAATVKGGAAVSAGQLVEVKGRWVNGTLVAREVELEGYRDGLVGGRNELYGAVSSFTSLTQMVVNGVTVDASTARLEGGTSAQLGAGSYVEIKGNMQGNVLKATKLEFKAGNTPSGGYFEQNGVVSNFVSVADFKLNGMKVDAGTAVFERGTAASLANGVFVEIKGSQNAAGVFKATKVELSSSTSR